MCRINQPHSDPPPTRVRGQHQPRCPDLIPRLWLFVRREQCLQVTREQWETSVVCLAPLCPDVLTIIRRALELPPELLTRSEATEAIFENTHKEVVHGAARSLKLS